jgi:polysaccharide export outer membrane protein
MGWWTKLAVLGLVVAGLAGCAGEPPPLNVSADSALQSGYRLDTGDKLHIIVYNETSITGDYNISPDGTVDVPLAGAVKVRGLSIAQAVAAISARLADGLFINPRVDVEVLNYRPYYILGEVAKPGEYPFVPGMTVTQAIAAAGGFTYRANQKKAFLLRASAPGERTVRFKDMVVPVMPGDTIRIGERYF